MRDHQRHLEARYAELRDSRTGPVFFLEHGLSLRDTADLMDQVRAACRLNRLDSDWWEGQDLPLIVTATEVGYRYRGTGTDFWPELERELAVHISDSARQRVRDRFAAATDRFRGVHPPSTAWAEAFHLIAWPITHALVPIELHLNLARTLESLRVNVEALDDDQLHQELRRAARKAGITSPRFQSLLANVGAILAIARSVLGVGTSDLSPEAAERIATDLKEDRRARRSLTAAREIQRTAPRRPPVPPPAPPAVRGALQLRLEGKELTLWGSFPTAALAVGPRLRKALRQRCYAPSLWGVTAPVPGDQLLSGILFPLRLEAAPAAGAALLSGLAELELEADLRDVLASLHLEVCPPLLFAVGNDGEAAKLVHGRTVTGFRRYWLLTDGVGTGLEQFPKVGQVGPYTCHLLDPSEEGARQALPDRGFTVEHGVSVRLLGAPPLDPEADPPTFLAGDRLYLVPRREYPDGLLVQLDDGPVSVVDGVVGLDVPRGEHRLRVRSGSDAREFPFRGVSAPGAGPGAVCSVTESSGAPTVQALLRGHVGFTLDSPASLQHAQVTVELEAGGGRWSATASVERLPQTITSTREPLATLLDSDTREILLLAPTPSLTFRVGKLCARTWTLEQRVSPCWWGRTADGGMVLLGELGPLPFGEVDAARPHLAPELELGPRGEGARLLAPLGLDPEEFSPAAAFSTWCVAPRSGSYLAPPIARPGLVRRLRGSGASAGLEELVEAYLRWALAGTDHVVAEWRRRQVTAELEGWVTEICCGEAWAMREAEVADTGPWELLVDELHGRGLGRDSYVVDLPDELWRECLAEAVLALRRESPQFRSFQNLPDPLLKSRAIAACDAGYDVVRRRCLASGRPELAELLREADASADDFDGKSWKAALSAVALESAWGPLAELLLPTSSAPGLMSLDHSQMTLSDLAEVLSRWAAASRKAFAGSPPPRDTLQALVALWVEPESAVASNWRGALETLLVERPIARAVRYLALQFRRTRGLSRS